MIAVVGMAGAGKSEVSTYFRETLGFGYLRFGDVVENGVKALGQELNETNERAFREKLRVDLGMKAMAIKLDPLIEALQQTTERIVLDGLYSWEEYEYLKAKYPELLLVCVYATPQTRYGRLAARPHRPLTLEQARSRDIAELVNSHKGPPIALADFLVTNEGTIEELYQQLARVWEQIQGGKFWH